MTAPDRIWCHPTERQPVPAKDRRNAKWVRGRWKDHDSKASGDVEYIRADLAKAQAEALLRQAAEACTSVIKNIDTLKAELADQRVKALVEAAYAEGFSEGADGGWIDGDYSKPWSKSDALRAIGGE